MATKLSVVVSFFNEEEVLPVFIKRLRDCLCKECANGALSGYELIFVNDCSTDRSEEVLIEQAEQVKDIKIITMSRNFGISPCALAGMESSTGDMVIYMDADLQDPPELIPQMLKAQREGKGIDVVNTVRSGRKGETFLRLLATRIGYIILKRAADINFLIEAGDFKLLSRRAVNRLLEFKEKRPFLRALVYRIGFNQATVHYHRDARYCGKSKFPLSDYRVVRDFVYAFISLSDAPLHFMCIAGSMVVFFGFSLGAYAFVQRFILRHIVQGWTVVLAAVTALGGMQLLAIGIAGLYINAALSEARKRPNYIISRRFGFD